MSKSDSDEPDSAAIRAAEEEIIKAVEAIRPQLRLRWGNCEGEDFADYYQYILWRTVCDWRDYIAACDSISYVTNYRIQAWTLAMAEYRACRSIRRAQRSRRKRTGYKNQRQSYLSTQAFRASFDISEEAVSGMDGLSEDDQELVRLKVVEGLSWEQIAICLNTPSTTLRKRYSRILKKWRQT